MKELNLEEGEVICSLCDGTGVTFITNDYWMEGEYEVPCYQCDGEGKTDWVTNIMGVPEPDYTCSSTSTSQSSNSVSATSISSSILKHKYPPDPRTEDLREYAKKIGKYFARKILPEAKTSDPIIEDLEKTIK